MRLPIVALVGRPNVGKSTLFNRFVGSRMAIVEDVPGTTRDRLYAPAEWTGVTFNLVDTGGLELSGEGDITRRVRNQAEVAVAEADVIILVTDARDGVTAADREVAEFLRRSGKPVVVAVSKAEKLSARLDVPEFWTLAVGEPYPVSGLHGMGTGDLLDAVVALLPASEFDEEDERLRVAIIGRPNVGKSTLVNRLVGDERVIVSAEPGTTRDAVDTAVRFEDEEIVLVDTAGIRRRGRVEPGIERYSVLRAMLAIERCDVAALLVDAGAGVTAQDQHIAGHIHDRGRGSIIVVNKWDVVTKDSYTAFQVEREIRARLKFLEYAPLVFISALTGQRATKVLRLAREIRDTRQEKVRTADLNRFVADVSTRHNPPSKRGKQLKIFYATQIGHDPPTFAFFVNDRRLVHFTYERYVENQLRLNWPFAGTPVKLVFRQRDEKVQRRRSRGG